MMPTHGSPECLHGQAGSRHTQEASNGPYAQVDGTENTKTIPSPCNATYFIDTQRPDWGQTKCALLVTTYTLYECVCVVLAMV